MNLKASKLEESLIFGLIEVFKYSDHEYCDAKPHFCGDEKFSVIKYICLHHAQRISKIYKFWTEEYNFNHEPIASYKNAPIWVQISQ